MPASAISIAASAIAAPVAFRKTHGSSTKPAERIADEAEGSLLRERDGVRRPGGRAAEHLRARAGSHSRRGARLRLAPALGAGQRRTLGDHGADQTRGRQRVHQPRRRQIPFAAASPVSTAGSTPAPPAVGAATMTPIAAFTSCTASARASTSRKGVPASGPAGPVDQLRRIAADEPRRRFADPRPALLDRALHDVERAAQHVADLARRDVPDRRPRSRSASCDERECRVRFGVANGGGEWSDT